MNKKLIIISLLVSTIVLSGCNFFGLGKQNNQNNNGDNAEATPFQREYEEDQKSDDGNYQLDLMNSNILWDAKGSNNTRYKGTIKPKSGSAGVEEGSLKSAEVVIDLASIKTEDNVATVETFLKGQTYFNVQTNPEAVLKINSVERITESPQDELNYEVQGEITINGKIKDNLEFDASIVETADNVIKLVGEIDIDMEDFGATSGTNNVVDNKFEMNIEINFKKA